MVILNFLRFRPYSQVPVIYLPGSTQFVFPLHVFPNLPTRFNAVPWSKVSEVIALLIQSYNPWLYNFIPAPSSRGALHGSVTWCDFSSSLWVELARLHRPWARPAAGAAKQSSRKSRSPAETHEDVARHINASPRRFGRHRTSNCGFGVGGFVLGEADKQHTHIHYTLSKCCF